MPIIIKPPTMSTKFTFELMAERAQLVFHTLWMLANQDNRIKVDVTQWCFFTFMPSQLLRHEKLLPPALLRLFRQFQPKPSGRLDHLPNPKAVDNTYTYAIRTIFWMPPLCVISIPYCRQLKIPPPHRWQWWSLIPIGDEVPEQFRI